MPDWAFELLAIFGSIGTGTLAWKQIVRRPSLVGRVTRQGGTGRNDDFNVVLSNDGGYDLLVDQVDWVHPKNAPTLVGLTLSATNLPLILKRGEVQLITVTISRSPGIKGPGLTHVPREEVALRVHAANNDPMFLRIPIKLAVKKLFTAKLKAEVPLWWKIRH